MIKNTKIDLSKDSQIRIDAINTIKYTLLLKYEVPKINRDTENEEWVETIMEKCRECCSGLFGDYNNRGFAKAFFGKFGYTGEKTKDGKPNSPLNYMDGDDKCSKELNLYDMILQQCIMSSYHAILTALIGDETISFYDVVERIKPHKGEGEKEDSLGIHCLVKKRKYNMKKSEFIKNEKSLTEKKERWSTEGAFTKTTVRHLKYLSSYEQLFKIENLDKEKRLSLQFSDLWCKICAVDAKYWDFEGDNIDWIKKIRRIDKKIFKKSDEDNQTIDLLKIMHDKIDGLYAFYLSERLFNVNLFHSMLQFIEFIEKSEKYDLSNKHMLNTLIQCKKLPNVFSRQCFLGYAMGKIITQPESAVDYWFDKDIKIMDAPIRYTDAIETGFQITTWLKQFYRFVNYMSEFIIPMYEWCFIGMLLETIENVYGDEQFAKSVTKEDMHREHLIKAFELLTSYMDKHAMELLQPVNVEVKNTAFVTKNLSLLMKTDYDKGYNLSKEAVAKIAETFLVPKDDEELELNLKIINPKYFQDSNGVPGGEDKNLSRLQKFYTELIKRKYLNNFGK